MSEHKTKEAKKDLYGKELKPNFANANPVSLAAYEGQAMRVALLGALYKRAAPSLLDMEDLWVGRTMMRYEIRALVDLLAEKGLITHEEFLDKASSFLGEFVAGREKEHRIVVTSEEVLQDAKALITAKGKPVNG